MSSPYDVVLGLLMLDSVVSLADLSSDANHQRTYGEIAEYPPRLSGQYGQNR